jgi:hypothetical protein
VHRRYRRRASEVAEVRLFRHPVSGVGAAETKVVAGGLVVHRFQNARTALDLIILSAEIVAITILTRLTVRYVGESRRGAR